MNTHLKVIATLAATVGVCALGVIVPKALLAGIAVAFVVWLYAFLYVVLS